MRSAIATAGLSLAAVTLLWAQAAQAQEDCRTDADCGADRRCEKPVSIGGCAATPDAPPDAPPCGAAEPVVADVGYCVLAALGKVCSTDADCGPELVCASYASDLPCSSDEPECGKAASDVAATESRCEYPPPEPLLCDADDSCAPPFACDLEQEQAACYYPDQSCESDDDCAADFDCIDGVELAGDCQECDKPSDGGNGDPVCRSVPCSPVPSQCSPKLIACSSDGDCPEAWLCRDIDYNYRASQWGDDVLGTKACIPGGLVQVAEGNYYLGGFVTLDSAAAADGQAASSGPAATSGGAKGERDNAVDSSEDSKDSKPAADSDGDASAMSESGGCSVALPGQGSARGLGWIAFGLIAFGLRRRRR